MRLGLDFFVTAVASVDFPKSEFTYSIVVMVQDKEKLSWILCPGSPIVHLGSL